MYPRPSRATSSPKDAHRTGSREPPVLYEREEVRRVNPEVELRLPLRDESDVGASYRAIRAFARNRRMPMTAVEELVTAASEIARNVIDHAGAGELRVRAVLDGGRHAVVVTVDDSGAGIADIAQALEDGYSTGNGLGLGLSSARRLVDDFEIRSVPNQGTTVTLVKWIDEQR